MYFKLKKSKITNWWVAPEYDAMQFVNILKKGKIEGDFLVVGEYEDELATSTNKVVKITETGVITAKGTYYPFNQANGIYLEFLIQCNKKNAIIIKSWEWIGKNEIIANIENKNNDNMTLKCDFTPYLNNLGIEVAGSSITLKTTVVVNPFREGNYCSKLSIPQNIKRKIWAGRSYVGKNDKLKEIRNIYRNNINNLSKRVK